MQEKVIARESSSYEAHSCEMKVYSSAKNVVAKRKRKQSKSERDSTRRQQQKIRVTMFVRALALALATIFWTLESAIKHTAPWFDCHRHFKGHMACGWWEYKLDSTRLDNTQGCILASSCTKPGASANHASHLLLTSSGELIQFNSI